MFPFLVPSAYRRLIGRLIYLSTTHPDITYVVQHLSPAHNQVAFRILRYLKNASGYGIFLATNNSTKLKAFSDSYWAGYINSCLFITSFFVCLGNFLIS